MSISNNNKTIIICAIVSGIIMGFTLTTAISVYGIIDDSFRMTPDLQNRLVSNTGLKMVFECPNDSTKTFPFDVLANLDMTNKAFKIYESLMCGDKTTADIFNDIDKQFADLMDKYKKN